MNKNLTQTREEQKTKSRIIDIMKARCIRNELNEIFGDVPFMLDDEYEVDAMYVSRGHLYFSYFNKDNKEVEREIINIESYNEEDIAKIYDYLINNA